MERCKCGDARDSHFAMKTAWLGRDRSPRVVCWGKCRMLGCACEGYRAVRDGGAVQPEAAAPAARLHAVGDRA